MSHTDQDETFFYKNVIPKSVGCKNWLYESHVMIVEILIMILLACILRFLIHTLFSSSFLLFSNYDSITLLPFCKNSQFGQLISIFIHTRDDVFPFFPSKKPVRCACSHSVLAEYIFVVINIMLPWELIHDR